MSENRNIAVYGAYGHTGNFVVAELLKRGWNPIISGRDADKLQDLADKFGGLEMRPASVDEAVSLDLALRNTLAVINCAGPFAKTASPVIESALRAKIPYLDVAAEVEVVAATFENFSEKAVEEGIVIIPSIAFFGGLGDLLATAAMNRIESADEINVAFALDSWKPTIGTRNTIQTSKQRRNNQRLVFSNGKFEFRTDDAPVRDWNFPPPFGTQKVIGEFTTADSVTIPSHLKTAQLNTFMSIAPLKDLSDADLSPPQLDASGRSSQNFLVEVIVRSGNIERKAVAAGRDIYAVSSPLVVEAMERIINNRNELSGVISIGNIPDPRNFLESLSPEHFLVEFDES
jgi:short subunit dehydrogenase-like uncharacterized protein